MDENKVKVQEEKELPLPPVDPVAEGIVVPQPPEDNH